MTLEDVKPTGQFDTLDNRSFMQNYYMWIVALVVILALVFFFKYKKKK